MKYQKNFSIFLAYTTFFILGLLLSMQIPFVGFQPIRTSEHMLSAGLIKSSNITFLKTHLYSGMFLLLQAYCFLHFISSKMSSKQFKTLSLAVVGIICVIALVVLSLLTYAGKLMTTSDHYH